MNAKNAQLHRPFLQRGRCCFASAFFGAAAGERFPSLLAEFLGRDCCKKRAMKRTPAIFYSSRLPRVLGAILAGVAFSQAGNASTAGDGQPPRFRRAFWASMRGAGFLRSFCCFVLLSPRLCLSPFGGVSGGAACDRSHIGRGALGGDEPRRHRACGRRPSPPSFQAGISFLSVVDPRRALLLHRFFGRAGCTA